MAKRFRFEDEFDDDIFEDKNDTGSNFQDDHFSSTQEENTDSINDEKIDLIFSNHDDLESQNFDDDFQTYDEYEEDVEDEDMSKKKRKIKPWHIVLIVFILLIALFFGYIFFLTNTDGPVFGNRCDGVTSVNIDARNNTISTMKSKYSEIEDLTIEIVCKEIKVDIVFKDNMDKNDAKKIGEAVVQDLDKNVGLTKDEGKTYSQLFGYIKNEAQYDCQLYLVSKNAKDFPIYGTKHHSQDKFSYTYASVRDKESKEKAESTLKEE